MHIDLNSCFATAEQQANPLLRDKPLCVAAYNSPNSCVISPSIEAKKLGIKVGMQVRDARLIYKNVIIRTPDPPKYRDIHQKFCKIFRDYSPNVTPKSIDEAVIDFNNVPAIKRGLVEIGREIKRRMRKEIGEWISCSIGIAPNRFLAKLGASLHKPDGLDVITYENLEEVYGKVNLIDLCGINTRFQARLNAYGISTPLEFLQAKCETLQHQVFKSICGYYWYLRLRGWEIDAVDFSRKSYGHQYALQRHTSDPQELYPMLMKLCEKTGRRLRRSENVAYGVHVSCVYNDHTYWHQSKTFRTPLYTTTDLYIKAILIFNNQPERKKVSQLAVSCFYLVPTEPEQLDLFYDLSSKKKKVSEATDKINDKYGEFVITPARMMGMKDTILDRVAFGGVKELEDLYGHS